jgi:hypothetical protein
VVHPPDGDGKVWWSRLKKALGTSSSDFVQASLFQLQGAARLPGGGMSELAVNSALALIEATEPKNEIEAALAVQAYSRYGHPYESPAWVSQRETDTAPFEQGGNSAAISTLLRCRILAVDNLHANKHTARSLLITMTGFQ